MIIYLDLLLIFNFLIDLMLLISVSAILKRRVSFNRLVMGAFLGSFSILFLFYPLNSILLILLKLGMGLMMVLVAFRFHNLKTFIHNVSYLYIVSILLGGGLYMINGLFSFENDGLLFISNSYQLNFIMILLISPILIAYYVRRMRTTQEQYQYYFKTNIHYKDNILEGMGYIDSGNTLTYKKRPVILISQNKVTFDIETFSMVPYRALNHVSVLKCFLAEYILIDNNMIENVYLGIMEDELSFDGVDFLLHREMMEVLL